MPGKGALLKESTICPEICPKVAPEVGLGEFKLFEFDEFPPQPLIKHDQAITRTTNIQPCLEANMTESREGLYPSKHGSCPRKKFKFFQDSGFPETTGV